MSLLFDDFMGEVGIRSESYDKIDMSPMLAAVMFESKQLMGILGFEDPADNIIFEHLEDYVIPIKGSSDTVAEILKPETFEKSRKIAKQGGTIAGNARKEIEVKTGKKLISKKNARQLSQKKNKEIE